MTVQPYLNFEGRCEEAITFYRQALGAEVVEIKRYKDTPYAGMAPAGDGDKVMHAELRVGAATVMACDGRGGGPARFDGISLALGVPAPADAERLFAALADGGTVQMPLTETLWSKRFGMVADRFGVTWMVNVAA